MWTFPCIWMKSNNCINKMINTGKCFDLLSNSLNWVWENVWRSVWRLCMWILGYLRWWIHKMKLQQILDSQWLEKENHIGQVCSLNFWHCGYQKLIFVGTLGKQTEALAENRSKSKRSDKRLLQRKENNPFVWRKLFLCRRFTHLS